MPSGEIYYISPSGTEWTPEKSRVAIRQFHNIGRIMAGANIHRHHIMFERAHYLRLGGEARRLRNMRILIPRIFEDEHKELHRQVRPVDVGSVVLRGSIDAIRHETDTLSAMDILAIRFGRLATSSRLSEPNRRQASAMEEMIYNQRPYIHDGLAE